MHRIFALSLGLGALALTTAACTAGTSGTAPIMSDDDSGTAPDAATTRDASTSKDAAIDSSSGKTCALPPGFYHVTYTPKVASTSCTATSTDVEFKAATDGGADAGLSPNCTSSLDEATCTNTTDCIFKNSGYTTTSHTIFTVNGAGATGSNTNKTTKDADGSVLSDCTENLVYTKK